MIEVIWPIYDKDGSGTLDKNETRQFVIQYMESYGFETDEFKECIFKHMFKEIDVDGSG